MIDLMSELVAGVAEFLKQENLLSEEIMLNNKRLDVYRQRMAQHERFCAIMQTFLKRAYDEDGLIIDKSIRKYLMSEVAYKRVINCSSWFEFETTKSWQVHKIKRANRCMNKYCPHCSRVLALRRSLEANHYMEQLDAKGYRFLFLTLTVRNEKADNIKDLITRMNKAVADRFLKYAVIKKQFKGFIRKFEITYNKERNDFHPHIHLIVAVNKGYFNGKNYIKYETYRELWQRALQVDYLPQINIQVVRKKDLLEDKEELEKIHLESLENENFVHGAFEIGKYVAKSSDYLKSSELFEVFYQILFKRRNWTFGGVFKALHKTNNIVRFETELENNELDYEYITHFNHDKTTNNYKLTKVFRNKRGVEE